jgi:hypothetical protein
MSDLPFRKIARHRTRGLRPDRQRIARIFSDPNLSGKGLARNTRVADAAGAKSPE